MSRMSDVVVRPRFGARSRAGPARLDRVRLGPRTATAMVALGAILFALVTWFARGLTEAGIASPAVAFYRYLLTALVMLPFLRLGRDKRATTVWALAAGLAMGLGWIAYVEAIEDVAVSTVGVVYMSYPLFTLLAAWLVFRHLPTRRSVLGGLMVLVAAGIALSPAAVDPEDTAKLVYALAAPLSFGFAISVLTERLLPLHPFERMAGVAVGAVTGLAPLVLLLPSAEVLASDGSDWLLILGIGIGTALVPQLAYSTAAPFIGPARTAMAGAIELPTIFVIGWLAFGEGIGWPHLVAGALVVGAVVVTPSRPPPGVVVGT